MSDTDFDKAVRKEKNKIKRELNAAKISPHKMKIIEPVIENAATMKVRLDDLREMIITEDFMVEYDNGGGQKGIRENPVFKAYEALWKSYMLGMDKILSVIPEEQKRELAEEAEQIKPQTVLDIVREKKDSA